MMWAGLFVPLVVAVVDWVAVARGWKKLEYAAKPGVMLALLAWLGLSAFFNSAGAAPLIWFAAGLLLSLVGDVLLMLPPRFFIGGLAAFLLAHAAYIVGFSAGGWPLARPVLALALPVIAAASWLAWR